MTSWGSGEMFGGESKYSPQAVTLAKKLKTASASSLADAIRKYAVDAQDSQRSLLGGSTVTPEQAFKDAFGESSLNQAIKKARTKSGGSLGNKPFGNGPAGNNPERGSFSMRPIKQDEVVPPFYSKALKVVQEKLPNSAPGEAVPISPKERRSEV
jgi:hypothetical protein